MEEKKVRSVRLDDDTNEKFKSLCAELGGQSECVTSLIKAFELNRSKSVLIDMSADINEFESLVNRIVSAYTHALALKQDAEVNAKEVVERDLKAKDDIISMLSDELSNSKQALKDKDIECKSSVKETENKLAEAIREVSEANNKISHLNDELNALKATIQDKQAIIDGLTIRIPETEQLQENLRTKEIEISTLKTQYASERFELNNKILELNNGITSLSDEIKTLKAAAEVTDQKHKVDITQAITETRLKYLDQIEQLRMEKDNLKDEIYSLKVDKKM